MYTDKAVIAEFFLIKVLFYFVWLQEDSTIKICTTNINNISWKNTACIKWPFSYKYSDLLISRIASPWYYPNLLYANDWSIKNS